MKTHSSSRRVYILPYSYISISWLVTRTVNPDHRTLPRPRVEVPLAIPLGRGIPPPRPVVVPRFLGAGVENLDDGLELAGGFSTKDVSVVLQASQFLSVGEEEGMEAHRKVASPSPPAALPAWLSSGSAMLSARAKDSAIGAYKSRQTKNRLSVRWKIQG